MTRAPSSARRSPSPNPKPAAANSALTRWRDGKTEEVVVKLPVLGTYSATAPYDCPKSKRILEQGCEALAKRMAEPAYPKSEESTRSPARSTRWPCWPAATRNTCRW